MNLFAVLPAAIEGTLIGQLAIGRGLKPSDVLSHKHIINELRTELTTLGVDCVGLSEAHLDALVHCLSTDQALTDLCTALAKILWDNLGDPENGGLEPPQRYVEATQLLWLAFLSTINPRFLLTIQALQRTPDSTS